MTAKDFCSQFFFLQLRLNQRLKEIDALQSMAKKVTGVISKSPSGNSKDVSRIENAVAEIYECTEKLAEEISGAVTVREKILSTIKRLENPNERLVIEMRYIGFDSWESIAKKTSFSLPHIFRLHRRALKNLETKLNMIVNDS